MTIAISTGLYYTKSAEEILDIIAKTKCDNIELFLNQAFIDIEVERIKEEVDKRNLTVTSIHLPLTFIAYERGETESYWILKGLEYAKVFDCQVIVTHFFYQVGEKVQNNDVRHLQNIKEFNMSDIYVCTENLPNIELETILKDQRLLKEFLDENNGFMTFDTTHAASHGLDLITYYDSMKKHIRNIHLSDFENGDEHKLLGHGDLDIQGFIQHLCHCDYPYNLTLEFDFENHSRNIITSDEEAVVFLNESIDIVLENIQE